MSRLKEFIKRIGWFGWLGWLVATALLLWIFFHLLPEFRSASSYSSTFALIFSAWELVLGVAYQ